MESESARDRAFGAYANTGLVSLAEASARAEDMDAELERTENGQQSHSKSARSNSGGKGKARKAYTITKQRERWTEEEHERFLQALKRYGRAWRKIEEHIGTKTAVQIRSHAQKFFSKLQRESGNGAHGDESSKNDISIPPPRPKRKPNHPYPRNHDASQEPSETPHPRHSHGPRSKSPQRQQQSETTASTQVPNSTSHGTLPGFPPLDTGGGEVSVEKVLKDAAMAAANAWSQVVANAGSRVQQQIQAQTYPQPSYPAVQPYPNLGIASDTSDNPFMKQLILQLASQQQNSAPQYMGGNPAPSNSNHAQAMYQRQLSHALSGSHPDANAMAATSYHLGRASMMSDTPEGPVSMRESDRDSACSKEKFAYSMDRIPSFNINQSNTGSLWGARPPPAIATEGRNASLDAMAQIAAQQSAQLKDRSKPIDVPKPARPTGDMRTHIFKPSPQSAKMASFGAHDLSSNFSGPSNTSQLAELYQRGAGNFPHHKSGSPSAAQPQSGVRKASGEADGGTDPKRPKFSQALNIPADRSTPEIDSNESEAAHQSTDKDPKQMSDAAIKAVAADFANRSNSGSGGTEPMDKASLPGSDKGSNNGSNSADEEANEKGSDADNNGSEGKGSDGGSNTERMPPHQLRQSDSAVGSASKQPNTQAYPRQSFPAEQDADWAAALQQSSYKSPAPLQQANLMQQMLPALNLTAYQQQALSAWAAANMQAQPQSFQVVQSLLANFQPQPSADLSQKTAMAPQAPITSFGSIRSMPIGETNFDRRTSCLTSLDTGSNVDTNISMPVALHQAIGPRSYSMGSTSPRQFEAYNPSSGFKPYSKRASLPLDNLPAAKRFAVADTNGAPVPTKNATTCQNGRKNADAGTDANVSTPFGSRAVQAKVK